MEAEETDRAKIEKPHAHFDSPRQVVTDPLLSKQEKMKCFRCLNRMPGFSQRHRTKG